MMLKASAFRWAMVGLYGVMGCSLSSVVSAESTELAVSSKPVAMSEMSSTDLLNFLVSEGVISKASAIKLITALRQRAERSGDRGVNADDPNSTVVVPYIPAYLEERIMQGIKADLAKDVVAEAKREGLSTPDWVSRIRLSGDVRVRYSKEFYPDDNPRYAVFNYNKVNSAGSANNAGRQAYVNVNDDRERLQGRARLHITGKPANNIEVGIRLTSGDGGNPVSANQTLGRYGAKWESSFDLAYIQYHNNRLLLSAGRMENPWLSSDLVWDKDMTFEGLFAEISPFRLGGDQRFWHTYVNLGAFPLQEIHQFQLQEDALSAPDDKWLYSFGIGSKIHFNRNHQVDVAITEHQYNNITGIRNRPGQDSQNASAAPNLQWFNVTQNIAVTLPGGEQKELYALAGEFDLLNFTLRYDYTGLGNYQMSFAADYVQNLAWDAAQVTRAAIPDSDTLIPDRDRGYELELGFATQSKQHRGDWGVTVTYRYLEGDAVVDAFADSDFLMGGTNAQGYRIKGHQFIADNTWLELTLISADEIDFPIGSDVRDLREDTLMLDLNARF